VSQALDLPRRDAVDEGFLDDRDQRLLGPATLRDEKRHIAALADLGHDQVHRAHPGVHSPGPEPGKMRRTVLRVLPFGCPDLGFDLDPHHLGHHPREHGQEGVGFRDELQWRLLEGCFIMLVGPRSKMSLFFRIGIRREFTMAYLLC
jgi:hypothetical protein